VTTARSTKPTIPPSARWLVWPEMNDKAAERANGDTQENGENEDRRAYRNKYLHQP
jgi:hypothetical protein